MRRVAAVALFSLVVFAVHSDGPRRGRLAGEAAGLSAPASQPGGTKAARAQARVDEAFRRVQHGVASYYAHHFDGRLTASGIPFDNGSMVAAHPTYPFGTILRVTNLANGNAVTVRVVDRGPARGPRSDGVVIDLSRAAAEALDFVEDGRTNVRLERLGSAATRAAARRREAAAGR